MWGWSECQRVSGYSCVLKVARTTRTLKPSRSNPFQIDASFLANAPYYLMAYDVDLLKNRAPKYLLVTYCVQRRHHAPLISRGTLFWGVFLSLVPTVYPRIQFYLWSIWKWTFRMTFTTQDASCLAWIRPSGLELGHLALEHMVQNTFERTSEMLITWFWWVGLDNNRLSGPHCSALCLSDCTERDIQESPWRDIQVAGRRWSPEVLLASRNLCILF